MPTSIGAKIRELRTKKGLLLRKAASSLDVDQSLLSKYERGERIPTEDFIKRLSTLFSCDERELLAILLSDRFLDGVDDINLVGKALKIAEQKIKYSAKK